LEGGDKKSFPRVTIGDPRQKGKVGRCTERGNPKDLLGKEVVGGKGNPGGG